MMSDLPKQRYLTASVYFAGTSLVGGLWGFVDVATSTKYVCATTNDNYVTWSKWLDASRGVLSLLAVVFVMYRKFNNPNDSSPKYALFADLSVAVTAVLWCALLITTGTVCNASDCIKDDAVNDCNMYGGASCDTFDQQVSAMTGATIGSSEEPCFQTGHWATAHNYCPSAVSQKCASTGQAERCLVYGCSSQVPGVVERYVVGVTCMIINLLSFLLLRVHESEISGSARPPAQDAAAARRRSQATPGGTDRDSSGAPASLAQLGAPSSSNLRYRHNYTPVATDIEF